MSWKSVKYLDSATPLACFAKLDLTPEELHICITNFRELWSERLTRDQCSTRVQELNANLEPDIDAVMEEIGNCLLERRRLTTKELQIERKYDEFQLKFRTKFADVPLRWTSYLKKSTAEEFFDMVMNPMLLCLAQYQRREEALITAVISGDKLFGNVGSKEWSKNDLRSTQFASLNDAVETDSHCVENILSHDVVVAVSNRCFFPTDSIPSTSDESNEVVRVNTKSPERSTIESSRKAATQRASAEIEQNSQTAIPRSQPVPVKRLKKPRL